MVTRRAWFGTIEQRVLGNETLGRTGTSGGSSRALRGASWNNNNENNLRVENRNHNDPSNRNNNNGFRVLLSGG